MFDTFLSPSGNIPLNTESYKNPPKASPKEPKIAADIKLNKGAAGPVIAPRTPPTKTPSAAPRPANMARDAAFGTESPSKRPFQNQRYRQ